MPKLDIKKIKRNAVKVFDTKDEMLKYIKKLSFRNEDKFLLINYYNKKWFVRWK